MLLLFVTKAVGFILCVSRLALPRTPSVTAAAACGQERCSFVGGHCMSRSVDPDEYYAEERFHGVTTGARVYTGPLLMVGVSIILGCYGMSMMTKVRLALPHGLHVAPPPLRGMAMQSMIHSLAHCAEKRQPVLQVAAAASGRPGMPFHGRSWLCSSIQPSTQR